VALPEPAGFQHISAKSGTNQDSPKKKRLHLKFIYLLLQQLKY